MEDKKNTNLIDFSDLLEEKSKELKKQIEKVIEEKEKELDKIKKIKLVDIVNDTLDFVKGRKDENYMDELGKKINIRKYLPILEKYRYLCMLIFEMNSGEEDHNELSVISLQKNLFFEVLLGAYCLIDVSDNHLKNWETMDLLYPIFAPFILQYCEKDYKIFENMLTQTLNLYHMKDITDVMKSVDYKEIKKASEENKRIMNQLNENRDTIKELKEMGFAFNPETRKIVRMVNDVVNQYSVEKANIKVSQEKIDNIERK